MTSSSGPLPGIFATQSSPRREVIVIDRPPQIGKAKLARRIQEPAEPPMYGVILHNDRTTPFDFVTSVLREQFQLTAERAGDVMMQAHRSGLALVVVLPRDNAESKVARVNRLVQSQNNPHFNRNIELTFSAQPLR